MLGCDLPHLTDEMIFRQVETEETDCEGIPSLDSDRYVFKRCAVKWNSRPVYGVTRMETMVARSMRAEELQSARIKTSRTTGFFSKIFELFSSKRPSTPGREGDNQKLEESSRSTFPGAAKTSSPVVLNATVTNSEATDSTTTEAVVSADVETPGPSVDEAAPLELRSPPPSKQDMPAAREKQAIMPAVDPKSPVLPASNATVDTVAGRAFVKKVIQYQQSNGSFVFPSDDKIMAVLGDEFYGKLTNALADVPRIIAVTALLLELLEAQFEPCRGLWVLVVDKARTFVESQAGELKKLKGAMTPAEVLAQARRVALGMGVLDLEEDGSLTVRRDSSEPVELQFAPAV